MALASSFSSGVRTNLKERVHFSKPIVFSHEVGSPSVDGKLSIVRDNARVVSMSVCLRPSMVMGQDVPSIVKPSSSVLSHSCKLFFEKVKGGRLVYVLGKDITLDMVASLT